MEVDEGMLKGLNINLVVKKDFCDYPPLILELLNLTQGLHYSDCKSL